MKPNWSLIAGGVFFVLAVFVITVVDGFNRIDAAAPTDIAAL